MFIIRYSSAIIRITAKILCEGDTSNHIIDTNDNN